VAQLLDGRLVRLLDAPDPLDEDVPVLLEDRLEQDVLRVEVVVEEPVRDAGLLRDVADAARVEALAREDTDSGVKDLTPLVLGRYGPRGYAGFPFTSATTPAIFPTACWNSLGMIQTLFASPCAICGSICRYW
jgi:hypothetical protein